MSFEGFAQIEWAIINGEPRHVSDFAHLNPKDRPEALCLDCNNPLIFKCGEEKVHHFCHKFGEEECAGKGEGILHYNAKLHIAAALRESKTITAFNRCSWCGTIGGDDITVEYDEVQFEYHYAGGKKADVGLLKKGEFCCGIEVFVSHRCELSKIAFHRNSGIPCFEVHAENASEWSVGRKLSPAAIYGVVRFICFMCERRRRESIFESKKESEQPKQIKEAPKELIRAKLLGSRIVRCRLDQRQICEFLVEVIEWAQGTNQGKRLQIREGFLDAEVLCEVKPPYTNQQKELFKQKYKEFIGRLEAFNYTIEQSVWNEKR